MAPFQLFDIFGKPITYLIYLLIGMGFGYALEASGFGVSTKLTDQFYFRDQTVFKVMFTAVLVAMVLLFGATGLGLLDYNRIWVPPTYLWPGILGGFLIGVGFIIGGFCPGTSVAASATGKIDGMFFVGGILTGIMIFGETVKYFDQFWYSSFMGRFTIPDWLGMDTGVVVFGITAIGLVALWGSERIERAYRRRTHQPFRRHPRWHWSGAIALLAAAFAVMLIGQPTVVDMWTRIAGEKEPLLANRQVQIHPAELRSLYYDPLVNLVMLDVRPESEYNIYHLQDAQRVDLEDLPDLAPDLQAMPQGTVFVLMSNDETLATQGWKTLEALDVPNVYILEGGLNNWLAVYGEGEYAPLAQGEDEQLRYNFTAALGSDDPTAVPSQHDEGIEYTPKVKIESKAPTGGGGCG